MSEKKLSRREFLGRALMIGAASVGAGAILTGCKKDGGGEGTGTKEQGSGLNCNKTAELSEESKKQRKTLKYVEKSTKSGQTCKNCQLYTEPKEAGTCGGCQVIKGPINPEGWCNSWVKKQG